MFNKLKLWMLEQQVKAIVAETPVEKAAPTKKAPVKKATVKKKSAPKKPVKKTVKKTK